MSCFALPYKTEYVISFSLADVCIFQVPSRYCQRVTVLSVRSIISI
jgi:hypothetical protein